MDRLDSGDPDVLAWTRTSRGQRLLVVVNFVGQLRRIELAALAGRSSNRWTARVGTHRDPPAVGPNGELELRPDEAVILEAVGD